MILKALRNVARRSSYLIWEFVQFRRVQGIKNHQLVVVLDIDNTLTKSTLNSPINHINPSPRLELISYVKEKWWGKHPVIFLSARKFTIFRSTIAWLKAQGFYNMANQDLFLVDSSRAKLRYLSILSSNNGEVVFVDDLTYNHENGMVLEYSEVADKLDQIDVRYLGKGFINNFN